MWLCSRELSEDKNPSCVSKFYSDPIFLLYICFAHCPIGPLSLLYQFAILKFGNSSQ